LIVLDQTLKETGNHKTDVEYAIALKDTHLAVGSIGERVAQIWMQRQHTVNLCDKNGAGG